MIAAAYVLMIVAWQHEGPVCRRLLHVALP